MNTTTVTSTTSTEPKTTTTSTKKTTTSEEGDKCPGVQHPCRVIGADNLACCGVEFGPGYAFCQTDPSYICCEGATYAISCPKSNQCMVDDQGLPQCEGLMTDVL